MCIRIIRGILPGHSPKSTGKTGLDVKNARRYVRFNSEPMCNLYLSMLDRMGVRGVERFGDSTGRLQGL